MTNEIEKASWDTDGPYLGNLTLNQVEALGHNVRLYPRESTETEGQDDA
jgi:hypothetical protein